MTGPTKTEIKIKVLKAEIEKVDKQLELLKQKMDSSRKELRETLKAIKTPADINKEVLK